MPKRKRVSSGRAVATSMRVGNWGSLARASRVARRRMGPARGRLSLAYMNQRLKGLTRMIETKECTQRVVNVQCAHNAVTVLSINPFICGQGVSDPMEAGTGARIGDQISAKGLLIRGMLECSLGRPKVYMRVMLIKCAKGDSPTVGTLFKGSSNNKMIDQISTERFTIVAQKIFTITTGNSAPLTVTPGGLLSTGVVTTGTPAGVGTKLIKMWVPGTKFGRGGNLQYEPNAGTQLKFFDYKLCIVAYDWFLTAQDINNVGLVNDLYTKLYFKDA